MAEIKKSQEPILNPVLVKAMDAMKEERNPRTESAFVNALKAGRFLVPADINTIQAAQANPDGTVQLKDQPQIKFVLFSSATGERYFPLFTDNSEIAKWPDREKHQLAAITYGDLCGFFRREMDKGESGTNMTGIVINPYTQNIMVPAESMFKIQNTEALAPGTKIQIGDLKEKPEELVNALEDFMKNEEDIEKAYLRVMKREDKENPNFLLVLDISVEKLGDAGVKALFDRVAEVAKPHLRGVELAIVPASNNFGVAALKNAVPFYEK
ncbi:MAG: enhanced serine sensitivity protein SseB C-terminal domain-containing protein [Oscillospiraceae bacterium]|nr:enhanced serine sensitivity protein SseB C-terminal domain-containing protein [Oscillospiraceae bacterium]